MTENEITQKLVDAVRMAVVEINNFDRWFNGDGQYVDDEEIHRKLNSSFSIIAMVLKPSLLDYESEIEEYDREKLKAECETAILERLLTGAGATIVVVPTPDVTPDKENNG
jgi:hypothetical protein